MNKPRMVTPNDDELPALLAYGPGDLGAPTLYKVGDGWRADAGEMERWRAGLQHTSCAAKPGAESDTEAKAC